MITKKQVALAIKDIANRDWQPNGPRAEGYSIILAESGERFYINSAMAERLRLRLNTIDRLTNADRHEPFKCWTVKSYPAGTELRFITEPESEHERILLKYHPDAPDYEISFTDGKLSLTGWLLLLRYGNGDIPTSTGDSEHYGTDKNRIGDLVDDFASDLQSLYKDGQRLYDHLVRMGCVESTDALNAAVTAYRDYCAEHNLIADDIDTWGNRGEDDKED